MIATFYSFRPELGCTMGAVNTGVVLAQEFGKSVLLVEWKCSATTLLLWLKELISPPTSSLLNLLNGYKELLDGDVTITPDQLPRCEDFVNETQIPGLHYLPASLDSERGYSELALFDWKEFYEVYYGGAIVEQIRKEWADKYEVVIVVGEKGINDAASVCAMQVPNVVVMMMSTNLHQIETSVEIARQLSKGRDEGGGRQVKILPLARVDPSAEVAQRVEFRRRFKEAFSEYLPVNIDKSTYFHHMEVPETPFYRYGHEIAVLHGAGEELASIYRTLAGFLVELGG